MKAPATAGGVLVGIAFVLLADAAIFYFSLGKMFVLVGLIFGLWQWVLVIPLLILARRSHRGLFRGALYTAITTTVLNVVFWIVVLSMLRGSHWLQ